MKKLVPGAVLGGLVLFVWSWIAHDVLPLGTAGVRVVAAEQEEAVLATLGGALKERAVFVFPGLDKTRASSEAYRKAWTARYEAGPAGIVAFDPHPGARVWAGSVFATLLGTELLTSLAAALVAGFVILHVPAAIGHGRRVLVVGALGLLVTLDVDASYWNWYGFPTAYFLAQLVDHAVGWFLAGLVLARFCRD
jgi:hypothetical protein